MTFDELTARGAVPTAVQTPPATPILTVVQHDEDVPLDRFTGWLDGVEIAAPLGREAGFAAVIRRPRQSGTRSSASTIVYA